MPFYYVIPAIIWIAVFIYLILSNKSTVPRQLTMLFVGFLILAIGLRISYNAAIAAERQAKETQYQLCRHIYNNSPNCDEGK